VLILYSCHGHLCMSAKSQRMLRLLRGASLTSVDCAGRDFERVLENFSSATAPAAEQQRGVSLEDLFQTLRFAAAVAAASDAGTAPITPPGTG